MKIAISFKGALYKGNEEGKGTLRSGALQAIKTLWEEGHELLILTHEINVFRVQMWVQEFIIEKIEGIELPISSRYEDADYYIDLRSITNWGTAVREINGEDEVIEKEEKPVDDYDDDEDDGGSESVDEDEEEL